MSHGSIMSTAVRPAGLLRHSSWDGMLIALSLVQAALLLTVPSVPLVAIGLWWNANTISHNFIHLPFFRSRGLNIVFSIFLSTLLGIPQSLWRARHLRHHRESTARANTHRRAPIEVSRLWVIEIAAIAIVWSASAFFAPRTFFLLYLPGWAMGLGLCQLQGHFEHARGTTSHYGRLYNVPFFNDGYHVEHHQRPGEHWTKLARQRARASCSSAWPPVLRWIEYLTAPAWLNGLERLVLRSRSLQKFVLARHERAFRRMLPTSFPIRRVTIVGGGLFPRTALVIRRLLPDAKLRVVDSDVGNLDIARAFLDGANVEFVHRAYGPGMRDDADLLVIPLAFIGDRRRIYEHPPAPVVLVHDWMWSTKSESACVSWLLFKRLNLVRQ